MDDGFGFWVGVFIVGVFLLWNAEPLSGFRNEMTVHHVLCDRWDKDSQSCSGYRSGERFEFRANPDQAEVVRWNIDDEQAEIIRYTDCAIKDYKNWECPMVDSLPSVKVREGIIISSDYLMVLFPQAAKWQWYLLDFGRSFKNGMLFKGSNNIPLIGEWFVFPSVVYLQDKKKMDGVSAD